MKLWKLSLATTIAMVLSIGVNASSVTHGFLTTNDDGSSNIISDELNNVEYLRLNVLADLNYPETVAVLDTQDGGGWAIATAADVVGFTQALLGEASTCPNYAASEVTSICGTASGWVDGDLGSNYDDSKDSAWFQDHDGTLSYFTIYSRGSVELDNFASNSDQPIGWLLIRRLSIVPEY